MTTEIIMDNDAVTLWYHTERRIVHHQVKSYRVGVEFRACLERGLETLREHGATKWLSDDRLIGPFSREDQEWCERVWFPRTRDAGWRYWAIVLPKKVLGQMSLQYFIKKYSSEGITARFFDNPQDALNWLAIQPDRESLDSPLPMESVLAVPSTPPGV